MGATTLEPGYTDTASSLGNGSIGCVPFALHGADCDPPIDSCVAQSGAPDRTSPIEMRYYGPVKWTGTTDPFKIERRKIDSTDLWIDQSACFDQAMHDTNDTIVVLTPKVASGQSQEELQAGFEYRVTLVQDGSSVNILRCFVTGDPEVADHASEYIFSVDDVNAGDADDNGIVNFADVTSVLSNWVTTDCLALGDADRDGDVDGGDLTSVNANWLNEYDDMCPNCIPEGAAASSPCNRTMRDAMKAMGFNNPGKFARWFGDLDRDERDLVTTGINEWLNCER